MEHWGIYVHTTAAKFMAWLEDYSQTIPQRSFTTDQGQLTLEKAHPHREISGIPSPTHTDIDGTLTLATGATERLPSLIQVSLRPIGRGKNIEVMAMALSEQPVVLSYLVQLLVAAVAQWQPANDAIWTHAHPFQEQVLGELRLKTRRPAFEAALQDFARAYHDEDVRAVSIVERRDLLNRGRVTDRHGKTIDPKQQGSWIITLNLYSSGLTTMEIGSLSLDCEISRTQGKYPWLMTLTCRGIRYRELEPFVAAFLEHCRATWSVAPTPVVTTADRSPADRSPDLPEPSAVPAPTKSVQMEAEKPPWEQIPNHLWYRDALKLWWQDYTGPEIAQRLNVEHKTVTNQLSILRRMYGEALVPTDQQRRQRRRKSG